MFRRTRVCTAALMALGGTLVLGAAPAFGQQSLERVEITGSSVRRIDAESAVPVQILKREDIERSGATNTVELMQRLPAIQGGTTESSGVGGGTAGFAGVSIHNVGETRTLVLLNGHRLALFGGQSLTGSGAGMDLNAIPVSAIERIEILTDGASAIYGADAIAGVVNFITRRNTNEGDISFGVSGPKSGARETRISASKGFGTLETDGFNVMLTASHDERTKLDAKQRDFGKTGKIFFSYGGKSYRKQQFSPSAIPGNVLADNETELLSPYLRTNGSCPDKTFRVTESYQLEEGGQTFTDDYCGFDFVGELEIFPTRKRDSFLGSVTKKVGDQELFFDALLSKTNTITRIAPVPGAISIPTTSPLFQQYLTPLGLQGFDLDGSGPGTETGTIAFYRLYDLGKRENNDKNKFLDFALGSKGTLFAWDYNATYTHSESDSKSYISGYPGALAVGRLTDSGLLDPFVGPGQQSAAAKQAIAGVAFSGYWDGGTSKLDTLSLRGSREVTQLPAGPMLLGAGVSYQKEKFQSKPSLFAQGKLADPVAGTLCDANSTDPLLACDQRFGDESATVPYSANRHSYGIFGELVIPATKALEFTTSLRYDKYSDFGNATTAKAGFKWQPQKELLVRGSIGTGFHAPTVPQVNAVLQPFGVTSDKYTCTPELQQVATSLNANCQPGSKQYDQLAGGNPDLQPEKSKQATLGIRVEPNSQLSMGADLWHVQIKDSFGQLTEQQVFANPLQYQSSWGTKTDTGTGVTYLAFKADNRNLGKFFSTGLDLDVTGRMRLPFGDLTSQAALTYMIREDQQLSNGGPYYSAIGNFAEVGTVTFRWQGKWTNSLKVGNWNHTLVLNVKSGYTDQAAAADVLDASGNVIGSETLRLPVKRYATLDWQTDWTVVKGLTLTVGALNVFNVLPPLAISTGGLTRGQQFGYDDRYYDSRGRVLYANASYKF